MLRIVKRTSRGKPRPKSPHDLLVAQICDYLNSALPRRAFFTVIFNGGGRNMIRGPSLESQGVKRGLMDVLILYDRKAYCLEAKAGKDTLSPEQRQTHAEIQDALVPIGVVRSVDDVQRFLRDDCGLWLRATPQ